MNTPFVRHLPFRFLSLAAVSLILAVCGGGCSSCKPGHPKFTVYPITITIADDLKDSRMEVDLVGVNQMTRSRLWNYSMTSYWKAGNDLRASVEKVTLSFPDSALLSQTLSVTNPIWRKEWKGDTHIVILAKTPGKIDDQPGDLDPRRQVVSLNKCRWEKRTKSIDVVVERQRIHIRTPPKPGAWGEND